MIGTWSTRNRKSGWWHGNSVFFHPPFRKIKIKPIFACEAEGKCSEAREKCAFRLRHSSFLSTSCFRERWTYDKIGFTKPRNACYTYNMFRKNNRTLQNKSARHAATSIQRNTGLLQNLHQSFWMISVCCLSAERKALSTKTPPTRHRLWDKVGNLWKSPTFSNPPVMTFKTASRVNLEWKNNCKPSIFILSARLNTQLPTRCTAVAWVISTILFGSPHWSFSQVAMFKLCLDFHGTSTFPPYPQLFQLEKYPPKKTGLRPVSSITEVMGQSSWKPTNIQ